MKARQLPQQKAEAWVSAVALNRMTSLGLLKLSTAQLAYNPIYSTTPFLNAFTQKIVSRF